MKDSLQQKVQAVEEEHFAEVEQTRIDQFDQAFRDEALEFRGGLRAVTSINRSLSSKLIEGLMLVEEKKYYLAWGFKNFAEYLGSDEVTDIGKNKYYDLKKLLQTEGSEAFDVFTGRRIPVSARKQLATKGVQIAVDGDELVIADQRVPISDKAAMKDLVESVHVALKERDDREEKKDAKIEKLSESLKKGREEFDELRRNYDALQEDGPFAKAVMKFFGASQTLIAEIQNLPTKERAARGKADLQVITEIWFRIRDAYGLKTGLSDDAFERRKSVADMKPVEEMTDDERKETVMDRALASLDDEGMDELD